MKQIIKALAVIVGVIAVLALAGLTWQGVRDLLFGPLEQAFNAQPVTGSASHAFRHAEIRRFIALDLDRAAERASDAGFECLAISSGAGQAVCYREIHVGICRQLWRLQLGFDAGRKVSRASGSIRQFCPW